MAAKSSQNKAEKTARQGRAQSITEVLGNVLEPVLARKTGMKLDLVKAWQELAGPDYAFTTRPEKIDWPRKRNEEDLFEPGVLVVACEPSAALFFQHDQKHIIERVNVFFGFEAIKRIKILQKPVLTTQATDGSKTTKPLSPQDQERLQNLLKDIDDPELRNRLL
ncbi:MAG: DciA family protein, partial [Rhizobiaceae bacterium]|nr:DciA family protein [Rhizobiaceae bacterium]